MEGTRLTKSDTVYATYFDASYMPRGLALIESMRRHEDNSPIWILCLDTLSFEFLTTAGLQSVHLFSLSTLESQQPELVAARTGRSRAEYIFTLGPTFLREVLRTQTGPGDVLVYLDADLYFFDSPGVAIEHMGAASVGIIEHRYPKKIAAKLEKYGRFNVGWVGFRNDASGRTVLDWWAQSCLEWCYDTPLADGRYADQGYLNDFPKFDGVKVLESPGFNLAPWNTDSHHLEATENGLRVDGDPLTFFHFQGIRETKSWFITGQLVYRSLMSRSLQQAVYVPYLKHLAAAEKRVHEALPQSFQKPVKRGSGIRGALFTLAKKLLTLLSILSGNAVRKSALAD